MAELIDGGRATMQDAGDGLPMQDRHVPGLEEGIDRELPVHLAAQDAGLVVVILGPAIPREVWSKLTEERVGVERLAAGGPHPIKPWLVDHW